MDSCLKKPHFLKPCVTSIDDPVAELPRRRRQSFSISSKEVEVLSKKICESGFRFANPDFKSWASKMEALHASTWKKAGIFEAIKASLYRIPQNPSLVLALVEKWCPETKSFVFPWGEATVTLEDVMVILEFSVLGSPVFGPLESSEMTDALKELEKGRVEYRSKDGYVAPTKWVSNFRSRDDKIEHDAFLVLWLSHFVFPNGWRSSISKDVFPIAVRLARGEKVALAPAVLASLYRDFDQICAFARDKSTQNVSLKSMFKLVQVWIWERFRNIRPKALRIQEGEPRIAQWSFRGKGCEKNGRLSFDYFEWRPYAKPLENWRLPQFYLDEAKWMNVDDSLDDEFVLFSRCFRVSQLVGIGFVEDYYPHREAEQFGFFQDLPLVTDHRNLTEEEAWDDYSKPLDDSKLYVPSRFAKTSVSARYQDWWLKSVSKFLSCQEPNGTFNASDAPLATLKSCRKRRARKNERSDIKQGECGGSASREVPLSKLFQKELVIKQGECGGSASREVPLSKLFQKELVKRTSEHLRNKRASEDNDESSTDCYDNISIAEMIKLRKKAGGNAEKIGDCDGSASKEMPLSELFQKELAKRTSEHLRNKRCKLVHEDDNADDIIIGETIKSEKKPEGDALESLGKRSRKFQVVDSEDSEPSESIKKGSRLEDDETVAQQVIEQRREENDGKKTGSKAEKSTVLIPVTEKNSDPPLGPNRGTEKTTVSQPETTKACDVEVDVNGRNAEKKTMLENGTKGEESLLHENGEKLCSEAKKEDYDERWKQRKLAIEELAMNLETRMTKVEKTLAMIREWKTRRNQIQT